MRKLYSLVLIAAGLLIGTNSWADSVTVTEAGDLKDYIEDGSNYEITLGGPISVGSQLKIEGGQTIVLNLNGYPLTLNFTSTAGILVSHGKLEITGNGSIIGTGIDDLVRVVGVGEETAAYNAKEGTPYSYVTVGANVLLKSNTKNVMTITQATSTHYSNGARIDVYGTLDAQKYGIKVNGDVKKPTNVDYSPYVYIASGAIVKTLANTSNAVAAYSSGYARWRIEGYCGGSTGLYAKSGDVEIVNAVIESTSNQTVTTTTGKTSGVAAGGSGIVIESNNAYPGETKVTITGETVVKGTTGYGIEEKIDNAVTGTKVEGITINGGTISGGTKGGIIVEATTKENNKVEIVNGTFGGTIQVEGASETSTVPVTTFMSTDTQNATHTAEVTVDGKTVTVILPGNSTDPQPYTVKLNSYGLATFSAAETVTLPAGLTAYKAGTIANDVLSLDGIGTEGAVIPKATGVILYGTPSTEYTLEVGATATMTVDGNNLKPAVAWKTSYAEEGAYILHGHELYQYTGLNMKSNKAFLMVPSASTPNGAPKRISLRFNQTEQTTAIDNVANEAVKAVKFVGADGQLYIRRGEAVYTVQGQLVK